MKKKQSGRMQVISNMLWRFVERLGAKGVSFIVSLILARILVPEVYGQIALITVIINLLEVFVDSGLGVALVQKKDADDVDFSSVFYFNFVICILLYLGMFGAAPFIARFYKAPELTPVIRVLSLVLVISGVKNIQQSYVSRTLQFKKFFFATLGGTIGAAILGITFAYLGFGIWALVIQQLFNITIDTLILWCTVKWRPKLVFSFERLKTLLSFGWKMLVTNLIDTFFGNIEALVIGKVYSSEDLAYYNRSQTFPLLLIMTVNNSMNSVLLPVMSKAQDDRKRLKEMTRRSIQLSSYFISPMLMGMFVIAPSFIRLILTEKWMPCVPYIRIFCLAYLFYPINTANLNAIRAIGRSDLYLKLNIIKKVIAVVVLVLIVRFGPESLAVGYLITSMVSQFINAFPNRKLLDYGFSEQVKDVFTGIAMSGVMALGVYTVSFLGLPDIGTMGVQITLGIAIYLLLSVITRNESFLYFKSILFQEKS